MAQIYLTTKNEMNVIGYISFLITAMRRIRIQVQTRLTTKYEIDVKICILFHITAMRPIWIGPDLPQRIKDSDKKWAEGA